ncbi:MAG: secretin N-terminal domain-containing protein [Candidatus Omnitrophota bacterium]|nr:secretin N-terminal domain-containing protein [Candidatus Omnitrophota bacterium]
MKKFIISLSFILIFLGLAFAAQADDPDLISLDLKGMDIRDVMKILSQKSGLNIVADNGVSGTVTLYLKDVSVMDAISIIASTNKLAYEETGTLIRIMDEKDYENIHGKIFNDKTSTDVVKLNYGNAIEISEALRQMKSDIGKIIAEDVSNTIVIIDTPENIVKMKDVISKMDVRLITEVFSLDYAKAELLKDKISEMVSKGAGSVRFDEKTNKLVVKDTQEKIYDIKRVIDAFDEKTRQVSIDANIIQVTLSDKYSYGINWTDVVKLGNLDLTSTTHLSTGLTGVTPSTLNIATTRGSYSAIVSLLKTYGETNILSRPRITVLDRQEARILVGSKEVYVTSDVTTTSGGTYHTTDHVNFVDVGVRLAVTPEINKAGFVTLKVKPEVSSADPTKTVELKNPDGSTRTVVPYVTTSEAETSVSVKDGTTIIIGGLMKDTFVNHEERVPFLGDMPLIGKLFSNKGKTKEKTELVILLTPTIVDGARTSDEAMVYADDWDDKAQKVKIKEPDDNGLKFPERGIGREKEVWTKISAAPEKSAQPVQAVMHADDKAQKTKIEEPDGKGLRAPKKAIKQKKEVRVKTKTKPEKSVQPAQKWTPVFGAKKPEKVQKAESPGTEPGAEPVVTRKTPYEEYYFSIRQDIINLARQDKDVRGIDGDVQLQFTLDSEGFVIKGPVVLNNPDMRLVRSAVKTVKKAMPFERFPKGFSANQADFNISIRYE